MAPASRTTSWVIWTDRIDGPWSDPVGLALPNHIDPGHAIVKDGSRWLFLSNGDRVRLSDDGLRSVGTPEHVLTPEVALAIGAVLFAAGLQLLEVPLNHPGAIEATAIQVARLPCADPVGIYRTPYIAAIGGTWSKDVRKYV